MVGALGLGRCSRCDCRRQLQQWFACRWFCCEFEQSCFECQLEHWGCPILINNGRFNQTHHFPTPQDVEIHLTSGNHADKGRAQ